MPRRRRDEDEEEAEEDYWEEEDEGYGDGKKRRRVDEDEEDEEYGGRSRQGSGGSRHRAKRRTGSEFFDLEAQVDSDEEEEEEDSEDDFIVNNGDELPDEVDNRRMHSRPILTHEDDQEDVEELERKIQARYARSSHEEYDEEITEVEQQTLLPSVRDPKLWMVKCAIGHEREVAARLMQKFLDKGSELQIRSVIALDHLKNYIYIEADNEAHVREACKGLRNIYTGSKILLVPIKEMTDVLSVESKAIDLSSDTWVRMKIGTYKGDLAKVVDVDNVRQRVTVKLIPRIDLQALANKLEGREVPKKKAFAPAPRLLNVDEARDLHLRVERRRNPMSGEYYENINGMMFKDGFLYKPVSLKSISAQNIHPTFDELEKFRSPENGNRDMTSLIANRKKGHFMKGDKVIILKGDLKNLKGSVERVEEDTVHIKPDEKGLPKTLAVGEKELSKYFEPGNHVKVVSGALEGATGMVVTVQGNVVNIMSDTTKEVLRVFAEDVSEVTSGITRIGDRNGNMLSRVAQFIRPQSPGRSSRGGGPPLSGGRQRGDDGLVGASIKVRMGPFKGYKGRVVDVKGATIRVELESQMKIVTVDRAHISDDNHRYGSGRETPIHPSSTPLRPYMRDPGATPIHDGMRTPMRGRAWNPYTPISPARSVFIC